MSAEFFVHNDSSFKKAMYLVKNALKEKGDLTLATSVYNSLTLIRLAENLERLNYIKIQGIETKTVVHEGKRRINLKVAVKKTPDFDTLFEENEKKRNQYIEERNQNNQETPA